MSRDVSKAGIAALLSFTAAAVICGAIRAGYSHREQPLAMLGAIGTPGATGFNVFCFIVPGLFACAALWPLRARMSADAPWSAKIGARLTMLSALAFAAQGLLPLDADDIAAAANGWHASAWTVWWISFGAGCVLLAVSGLPRGVLAINLIAVSGVLLLALLAWPGAMAAIAPRLAFVIWFVWVALVPMHVKQRSTPWKT